jgi:double-stranded uracil-DNA glycosylase
VNARPLIGFPPIARRDARLLILGSMPGEASLRAGEYYAHPRNAFWPIIAELLGFPAGLPYPARAARLRESGIALWDVLRTCHRRGSLDSAIDHASAEINDFTSFFASHTRVKVVCFNGGAAENIYRRLVLPGLPARAAGLERHRLPSTSPANARYSYGTKLQAWREIINGSQPEA